MGRGPLEVKDIVHPIVDIVLGHARGINVSTADGAFDVET